MTAIHLVRIDSEKNVARFYKLDVQPSLFGDWSLVREWGRIGQPGTVHFEVHGTRGAADIALIAKWFEKQKRGYQ
jgi:predicted DNA-binding WGR domain protein